MRAEEAQRLRGPARGAQRTRLRVFREPDRIEDRGHDSPLKPIQGVCR